MSGAPDSPPRPFALVETGAGGLRITAVNTPAHALGIEPGMTLSDACARAPGLATAPADRASDRAALQRLAHWMVRYGPIVAVQGEDMLILETTGCAHLWGGEAGLAADISRRLDGLGFQHRLAFAPTPGAAAALALAGQGLPCRLDEAGLADGLAGLPVAALRLSPQACQLLRRFGLVRIGQLYDIDRAALARRFAARELADAVLARLDQALGLRAEPLEPVRPVPEYVARLPCPEPLAHAEGMEAGLERLLQDLAADLSAHGRGARGFRLTAFRSDGTLARLEVQAARPVRAPAHALRLFRETLGTLDPGFGIDLMVLEALRVDAMEAGAPGLPGELAGAQVDEGELAALADRMTARLGAGAVCILVPQARHIPEVAQVSRPYGGTLPDWPAPLAGTALRPLRQFARPEPVEVLAEVPDGPPLRFVWRRVARRVVRAAGPERIAPEWWLEGGTALPAPLPVLVDPSPEPGPSRSEAQRAIKRTRDYYRIEDEAGRRYWVFRDGLYGDGRGGPPAWYIQGLFA